MTNVSTLGDKPAFQRQAQTILTSMVQNKIQLKNRKIIINLEKTEEKSNLKLKKFMLQNTKKLKTTLTINHYKGILREENYNPTSFMNTDF